MSDKNDEIQKITVSKIERDSLKTFQPISSQLSAIIDRVKREEMNPDDVSKAFSQVISILEGALNSSFKPKGDAQTKSTFLVNSSFFKQSKAEQFTYIVLSKLLASFKDMVIEVSKKFDNNPNHKQEMHHALQSFKKLVDMIDNINKCKVLSGGKFINEFNHKLISINDSDLIKKLISDYGLGSDQSTISEFIAKDNEQSLFKLGIIEALDNVLKNAPAYSKSFTPIS